MIKTLLLILAFLISLPLNITSQTSCASTFAKRIGSSLTREGGNSLAVDELNGIIYVAGYTNDSTLLLKMNLDGNILWSRTFDVLQDQPERVAAVILDSDGMIVIAGMTDFSTGGNVYMLKYEPNLDQILWVNVYQSSGHNYSNTMIEKGLGGNYLMSNTTLSPNDMELLEIDRETGAINPDFSKHYHIASSQAIFDMVMHNEALYAIGRFNDSLPGHFAVRMRQMLTQLDTTDGLPVWIKLGHRPQSAGARLNGADLVIEQNSIYSTHHGDPDGTDLTGNLIFVQKTSLTGEMEWLRQYQVPITSDISDEIIATGDGFVIMTRSTGTSNIILFKINHVGDVLWAKTYDFAVSDNTFIDGGAATQLVQVGTALFFTGYAEENGRRDMILVKTDKEGQVADSCFIVKSIDIAMTTISNGVFYTIKPTISTFIPDVEPIEVSFVPTTLQIENTCGSAGGPVTTIEAAVCIGQSYEGYAQAGFYSDTFPLMNGCDSIRILGLRLVACDPLVVYDLDDCISNMSNGSNMDYAEFNPFFPEISTCASVTASILYRSPPQENKHSCTAGLNNSTAMCVSALSGCNYVPGHQASVIMEVTITPDPSSAFEITNLQFQEKAPITYAWIDGDSGPNNYPTLFGLRILKNGTEIYSNPAITTNTMWSFHDLSFTNDSLFEVDEPTLFRFELLPYCPVGNGAAVAVWDLEDIVIKGGCVFQPGNIPVVEGRVLTIKGNPIAGTEVQLSVSPNFNPYTINQTSNDGEYEFNNLIWGSPYYVEGYNNSCVLSGVNTLDLISIQRHLLGIKTFRSLAQFIAADANHDGVVNILDIVDFRKTILGKYASFPGNTSWRFGVWPQSLAGDDLSTFEQTKYIEVLQGGTAQVNFLGIKIGDLNGELASFAGDQPIEIRSGEQLDLSIDNVAVIPGHPVTIYIRAEEDMSIEGLQLGWLFNDLTLVDIQGMSLLVEEENISFSQDGAFRMSWHTDLVTHINKGDVLFSLTLMSMEATSLAGNILQSDKILASEIYTENMTHQANLEIIQKDNEAPSIISFLGVMPNPFNDQTTIYYKLQHDSRVRISFYNASGILLHAVEQECASGEHIVRLNAEDIGHYTGMMICQIVCDRGVVVRKVVRVK